jgi:hypothetical protein
MERRKNWPAQVTFSLYSVKRDKHTSAVVELSNPKQLRHANLIGLATTILTQVVTVNSLFMFTFICVLHSELNAQVE